ncbi:FliM/FliN family flagellar motor switch protein [Zoogloea sp. LCSB751]|uniref:FliM/FliN family flagellar motor switch protein n=1 Tax=Zoogloea sp. LCSB751 TaxID=1965277 RepID=UPI0009A4A08E|nr:FliM/FliN family flagellar motor switch protein [Zoogloea sp. LCSB751]
MDAINQSLEDMLGDFDSEAADFGEAAQPAAPAPRPARPLAQMLRKIPVRLTLEVGSTSISLQDLMNIDRDSVIELDTLAGEPLLIKVNGTAIGRAEVVLAGENYGLKVVELCDLDLGTLAS